MSVAAVAQRTAEILTLLPDDSLGGSPIMDAMDSLGDSEVVQLHDIMDATAANAGDPVTRQKATKIKAAAKAVAVARELVRPQLAATKAYPEVFTASKAGEKLTAVAARRARLGTGQDDGQGAGAGGAGGGGVVRRPMGDLRYFRLWKAQGSWGRSGGSGGVRGLGALRMARGARRAAGGPAAGFGNIGRAADPIEAVQLGQDPGLFGVREGLGSLAGLNLGKFFGNLVKDVAPFAALGTAFIPGLGAAINPILGAVGAAAGGGGQQQMQAPVYGPAPLPPAPAPAPAKSGLPSWAIPAAIAAGVGLLALGSRK